MCRPVVGGAGPGAVEVYSSTSASGERVAGSFSTRPPAGAYIPVRGGGDGEGGKGAAAEAGRALGGGCKAARAPWQVLDRSYESPVRWEVGTSLRDRNSSEVQ